MSSAEKGEREIEHAAAAWLARHDRGLSAQEQDEFFAWLAADPRHGEWLAVHQNTVRGLKQLAQWRPEHAAQPNPDLLANPRKPERRVGWFMPLGLLVAASFAVAIFVWQQSGDTAPQPRAVGAPTPAALVTRRLLEDGSAVDVSKGTEIVIDFSASERRVRLVKGEAHFSVAKNPDRQFVVVAGTTEVRAIGTAFDVHFGTGDVEVLVTEGTVAVAAAPTRSRENHQSGHEHDTVLISAGHRLSVTRDDVRRVGRVLPISAADEQRLLARQPRQLEFTDAPLAQVVAEFNRENKVRLVVADPALASLPIGATLRSDNVDGFVRLLESSFHVTVERANEGVIVLRSRAPR